MIIRVWQGHENGNCTLDVESLEFQSANFQKNNPYSNTYNHGWKYHMNFKLRSNQNLNANQGVQQVPQDP